jgi:hypothetical protein
VNEEVPRRIGGFTQDQYNQRLLAAARIRWRTKGEGYMISAWTPRRSSRLSRPTYDGTPGDTFVDEPPLVSRGGKGVVVVGGPACRKRLYTIGQFYGSHRADVTSAAIRRAEAEN